MSTPSSESAGNGSGGKRSGATETLGSMSDIPEQLAALSRRKEQLAARMAEGERQRADETANAAAMRASGKAEEERSQAHAYLTS